MEPVALDVATSRFRERTPLDSDNVGGVVKPGAVDERRADTVDVDRHAKLLEPADLLGIEPARRDDPHVLVAALVERFAKELDETRRDTAKVAACDAVLLFELAQDRPIDERLARVDANAPEASAQRVRDTERRVHDVVVEIEIGRAHV